MRLPLKRIFDEKRRVTIPVAGRARPQCRGVRGVVFPLGVRARSAEAQAQASMLQLR